MPRILVTPHLLYEKPGPYREALEKAGLQVVYPAGNRSLMQEQDLAEHLTEIDGVLAGMEPFTPKVLAASKLRVIARMGVGYDAIDVPAATGHGIPVTITPGTNEASVAEQAFALMLAVFRGVPARDREGRSGLWERKSLPRLAGKTLGLVGLGRIGRAMVPRALGMGLRVIACDPLATAGDPALSEVRLCSLEEVLREANIVSLHCPAVAETSDLINASTLALMKPGSVLINSARGTLVDEEALADALESGHLFGAGLDVFKAEPLPPESRLARLQNVVLAPHMGGLDEESEVAMSRMAAECIAALYQGQWPEGCVVNEQLRQTFRW